MMHRQRRGISLLEILIVISLVSLILSLSSTMLIASFRAHERAVAREDLQRSLGRLALRLRTDAHAAMSADTVPDDAQNGLRLTMVDGRTISYEAGDGEIVRTVRREDTVEHRDAFPLPGFSTSFSISAAADETDSGLSSVVVEFQSRGEHPTSHAARLLPIEAAVGLSKSDLQNSESEE